MLTTHATDGQKSPKMTIFDGLYPIMQNAQNEWTPTNIVIDSLIYFYFIFYHFDLQANSYLDIF